MYIDFDSVRDVDKLTTLAQCGVVKNVSEGSLNVNRAQHLYVTKLI